MENFSSKILASILVVSFGVILLLVIVSEALETSKENETIQDSTIIQLKSTSTNTPNSDLDKTPTPTQTPPANLVPTSTPTIPGFGGLMKAKLSLELNISPSSIREKFYNKTEFLDSSLECPEPGKVYAQVTTPGWVIVFEAAGKEYEYHSDLEGTFFINCDSIDWSNSENIINQYNLTESQKIVISRRYEGNFKELKTFQTINEKNELLQTLDLKINKTEGSVCVFLYKIKFDISEKPIELLAICEDGTTIGKIQMGNEEKYYDLPELFLDALGEATKILPMPGKPKLPE